jgi:hypothetical protein
MFVDLAIPNPTKGRAIEYENKRKSSRKTLTLGLPSIKMFYFFE